MLEFNLKEERAGKAIMELQDKLREALDDKKEIEIEFVALKKNYLNLNGDLDQERARNDNIGVELVNLVNENKAMQTSTDKHKINVGDNSSHLEKKNLQMSLDLQEVKDALMEAKA